MLNKTIYALFPIKSRYRFHVYNDNEDFIYDFYMDSICILPQQFYVNFVFRDVKTQSTILRSFGLNRRQATSQKFYDKKVRRCLRVNGLLDVQKLTPHIMRSLIFNELMNVYIKPILSTWTQSDRYMCYISVFGV